MTYVLGFVLTGILVLSSLVGPVDDGNSAENKSPCFEEDVYACQASGGTFNWSHCTCEYW